MFFKLFTITAINLLSTLWLIAEAEIIEYGLFSLFLLLHFFFFPLLPSLLAYFSPWIEKQNLHWEVKQFCSKEGRGTYQDGLFLYPCFLFGWVKENDI